MRAIKKDPSSPGHASPPSLSLLHAALETRLSPPVSGTRSLTSAFLFCFVLGLLHGSGRLQCQLYPDGDCHLHQPGPAVVGAAHPGLLRGPIPDQSPPPLWSPYPLRWGLLQGWSREDHDGRQSSEHWQEGQGGTGEECFSTFGGGVGIGGDGEHSRQGEATTQNSLHILKREPWLKAVSIPGQTVIVLPQEIL